jgi:hypothetical protein
MFKETKLHDSNSADEEAGLPRCDLAILHVLYNELNQSL